MKPLVTLLKEGSEETMKSETNALAYLAANSEEMSDLIVSLGALQPLVMLLVKEGSARFQQRGMDNADTGCGCAEAAAGHDAALSEHSAHDQRL